LAERAAAKDHNEWAHQASDIKTINAHLLISSLRIACRLLSLQEICAPNITPTKGKKAALRIVTPPEKENVPPAAAPRRERRLSSRPNKTSHRTASTEVTIYSVRNIFGVTKTAGERRAVVTTQHA
jgi:hypothetical protein